MHEFEIGFREVPETEDENVVDDVQEVTEVSSLQPGSLVQAAGRKPKRLKLHAQTDSALTLDLRLYKDRSRMQKYRAELRVIGAPKMVIHYCNSMREAKTWVKECGERKLLQRISVEQFRALPMKVTLKTAFELLRDAPELKTVTGYFQQNEDLLLRLSGCPLIDLSVEDIQAALRENFSDERDRMAAISPLNVLLGFCHARGFRREQMQLRYNDRRYDHNYRCLRGALVPRVLPRDVCKQLYDLCIRKIPEDPYYLVVLLQLTLGMSCSEIAALEFADICDGLGAQDAEGDRGEDIWVPPTGPVWYIVVRRFLLEVSGTSAKHTRTMVGHGNNIYRYRLVAVSPQARHGLQLYLDTYGANRKKTDPLIMAKQRGIRSITLHIARHATREILQEAGINCLDRPIWLPSPDGIQDDYHVVLPCRLASLRATVEAQLDACGFAPHERRAYMGKSPYSTLDAHYWEGKSKMALLRQYVKIARWNLQEDTEEWKPEHMSDEGTSVKTEIAAPAGKAVTAVATIRLPAGRAALLQISAQYGVDVEYTVEHTE